MEQLEIYEEQEIDPTGSLVRAIRCSRETDVALGAGLEFAEGDQDVGELVATFADPDDPRRMRVSLRPKRPVLSVTLFVICVRSLP